MTQLATPEQLPALLRTPPWASGLRASEPPQLALPPFEQAPQLRWSPQEREQARQAYEAVWGKPRLMTPQFQDMFFDAARIGPEDRARLRAGEPLRDTASLPTDTLPLSCLLEWPASLAMALWNSAPAGLWAAQGDTAVLCLLATHGDAVVPGLLAYAARRPVQGLRAGRWLDFPELATLALKTRRGLKVARQPATDWLLAHPHTSAQVLLRQLFGADDAAREDARFSLHALAALGLQSALDDAAQGLGEAASSGLRAELATDPLLRLPARMPKLPSFFQPEQLHRPRLRDSGAALPDEALRHLGLMLAISRPEQPYAGLDAVREACTSASLAEFAWSVFEAWWAAEAPSKDAWAFAALGLLGDESTAHRLGPRAMRMAKEGAKNRALGAVDLLAGFGSDAALMHLSNLAERCKVPAVRNRAAGLVDAVAQQRGLSRTELADRLVPTLGLDESRVLDFGPRRFHIVIDEALVPGVKDAQGVRLKDLPKPRQSDDPALAEAAVLRYKQLKKEIKTLAAVQISRLEQAMVAQRCWGLSEFRAFFVEHALTRELAARLLWRVLDASGQLITACRIAEDGRLADAQDQLYEPPAQALLGIAHPLQLSADLREAFALQFADYQIMQPFAQLTRETYTLAAEEAASTRTERFNGRDVATGAVIGLLERGWSRSGAGDGGLISSFDKPLGPPGVHAALWFDPGMPVMQLSAEPRQTLGSVLLQDAEGEPRPFSSLDPVSCSELLRDLHRLTPWMP